MSNKKIISGFEIRKKIIIDLDIKGRTLVTFNKIHIKNKEEGINEILSKFRLRTIRIISPGQI